MSFSYDHTNGVRSVDAVVYLQVQATRCTRYDHKLKQTVDDVKDAKVVGYTQSPPNKPQSGAVVMKVTLRFPITCFLPLAPSAIIDVPATLANSAQLIEVEAEDPNDVGVAQYLAATMRGGTP